ncbi:uncharacterized protein PITG_09577 [Phytophthora infestans T30-4]|uniref:Secreted RxLR effector peptide protein n=1 Tax=Phytophthora infestans (strain T30-4) TaxID=403677 RepID=D0NCB3_PHYIT|nr:uncharacterized protein PITG_09577 [Phytophthora infestans T30-4]EEY55627.1 hypothetical protein PITG_09577 [Phytophthora infestans T30-4]|eukprot:XP_002903203.1 hypothetical protein PITG_09577 [Phytophthora infestans T30-4]
MHLHTVVMIVVTSLLAVRNVVSATVIQNNEHPRSTLFDPPTRQNLRNHHYENEVGDVAKGEERGLIPWKLKYKFWVWTGETPKSVEIKLGLKGLEDKAYLHPNYKRYLDFSKRWWDSQ